jgi:hypothetical protein
MKTILVMWAIATATLVVPFHAFAQTAPPTNAASSATSMMATMVCRPAMSGERATAMMMDKSTSLVCKPMAAMTNAGKMGPDLSHALTPEQIDAAWRAYYNMIFNIPITGGG